MTKAELIDRIARSRDLPPDISKKLIGQILGLAFDELAGYFARARVTRSSSPRFTFPHFGTFTKKRRSARRGVNPRTLEPIQIEACNTILFQASRELRESMNPGRAADSGRSATVAANGREVTEPAAKKSSSRASRKKVTKAGSSTTSKSSKPSKKTATKAKKKTTRTGGKVSTRRVAAGPGQRRLTPRDDDTALGTSLEQALFDAEPGVELPASPMQRVKGRRRSRSRGTG
ncbi:MAG: HU family DNA-binding protein [Nannocystaceae bacterium]